MKLQFQISSIIVALLFVYTINFKSIITIGYFANQTEIAELFCINKDKPQLQCNGKCHLATQLQEVESDQDQEPFSQNSINYNLEINSINVDTKADLAPLYKVKKSSNSTRLFHQTCKGYYSILSPPPKS